MAAACDVILMVYVLLMIAYRLIYSSEYIFMFLNVVLVDHFYLWVLACK